MDYNKEKVRELKSRKLLVFENIHHIKFESSFGCNLFCNFCGISKLDKGMMSKETFLNSIEGLNHKFKMAYFSGHGEPTLNPNLNFFVQTLRERFPKIQIDLISNNTVFYKKGFQEIIELFKSGLSQLQIDLYTTEYEKWFKDNTIKFDKDIKNLNIKLVNYYTPGINAFGCKSPNLKEIIYVPESQGLNHKKDVTRKFHNWAGNLNYDLWKDPSPLHTFPYKRSCSEPFKYLYILHNGDTTLCCRNGGRSLIYGNVNKTRPTEIWRGRNAQIVRQVCKAKRRDLMLPCFLCNYKSFRDGLYPYWGESFSLLETKEALKSMHVLNKNEKLYENLKLYEQYYPLPDYIKELMEN